LVDKTGKGMEGIRICIVLAIGIALWPNGSAVGQRAGSTRLVLTVVPEFRLDPSRLLVQFTVSPNGVGDIASQPAAVSAWARSLPGRQIHLTAHVGVVTGPSGPAPDAAIEWKGSALRSTAGGRAATCTSGSFSAGTTQELVAGWQESGILACAIAFRLANPHELAPGTYTAAFDLSLHAD
jgi:hypothetical protein